MYSIIMATVIIVNTARLQRNSLRDTEWTLKTP